jgi:uncharacterized protein YecT (DUF1311 family)
MKLGMSSRFRHSSKKQILAIAPALILALTFSGALASAVDGTNTALNCTHMSTPVETVICKTPDLRESDSALAELIRDRSRKLNPESSATLSEHQRAWYIDLSKCIRHKPQDLTGQNLTEAAKCIAHEYPLRRAFIDSLPNDAGPKRPDLLSAFEAEMLADGANTVDSYDMARPRTLLVRASVQRVVSAAMSATDISENIQSPYFIDAANNGTTITSGDHRRYFLGWTFERHAGFVRYIFFDDVKTGQVALGYYFPPRLMLLTQQCRMPAFTTDALREMRRALSDDGSGRHLQPYDSASSTAQPGKQQASSIEVIVPDNCKNH